MYLRPCSNGTDVPPETNSINFHLFPLIKGLGRRKLSDVEKSQHYSFDLISWQTTPFAKTAAGHRSTYLVSYSATPDTSSLQSTFRMEPSSLRKFHVITKDGFHRFPHKHRLPASTNQFKPTTDTTAWFNQPHMTPLQVLAQTQQPFTKKNQWKYSYKFR